MKHKSRIRGHADLIRPLQGGGVVNTNQEEYAKAKRRLAHAEKQKNLETRVSDMEGKLNLILSLLQKETSQ